MINIDDLPATMSGTMKEQLLALAPYMTEFNEKRGGGFVVDMKIPIEAFLTFNINHAELAVHDMQLSVTIQQPEEVGFDGGCGRLVRRAKFAEVQLTYQ